MDIEKIIDAIIDGKTYREMAVAFGVTLSKLHRFTSQPEHSARVREALTFSGDTYADKAEESLITAVGTLVEVQRARELAQHYRWKASKRTPKVYGDKIDVTSDGEKLKGTIVKWGDKEITI